MLQLTHLIYTRNVYSDLYVLQVFRS